MELKIGCQVDNLSNSYNKFKMSFYNFCESIDSTNF